MLRAVLLVAAVATAGCGGGPSSPSPGPDGPGQTVLSGEWERFDGAFPELNGMVVRVGGNATQGVIVSTPPNRYLFQAGDVKWRNIWPMSDTEFTFEDLGREEGTGAESFVVGVINVQPGGQELELTFPTSSSVQRWRAR